MNSVRIAIALFSLIPSTLLGQENGQILFDSLSKVDIEVFSRDNDEYAGYEWSGTKNLEAGYTLVNGVEYFECYGDICYAGTFGLISPDHDTIPPIFHAISIINDEHIVFSINDIYIITNIKLEGPRVFRNIGEFANGFATFSRDGKMGMVNQKFEVVMKAEYEFLQVFDASDRAVGKIGGKWKIIPKSEIMDITVQFGWDEEPPGEFIVVHRDGKKALIKETTTITPFKYADVRTFPWGTAAVAIGVEDEFDPEWVGFYWGILDRNGKEITPLEYDEIVRSYMWGYFLAKKNGKYGLIDPSGKEATPFKYSKIATSFEYNEEIGNYAIAAEGRKYGIIDYHGKELCAFEYDEIRGCLDCHGGLQGKRGNEWKEISFKKVSE